LRNISIENVEKTFYVKIFLDRFAISNQNRLKIIELILVGFSKLVAEKKINSNSKIIYKDESSELLNLKKLDPSLIRKANKIYFYETIKI